MAQSIDRMGYTDSFNYGKQGTGPKTVQKKKIAKPTPKPASYDKSTWDTKTKVSQGTIDEIKKMGMTKALGSVKGAAASSKDDSSAKAFAEGVRRLYGDQRYNKAVGKPSKAPTPSNFKYGSGNMPSPKPSNFKYGSGTAPASTKKPESGFTNTGRKVAGVGAAALTAVAIKKLGPVGAAMAAKGAAKGLGKDISNIGKSVSKLVSKPKAVGTKAEFKAKSASDASRKVIQDRMAKKAAAKKVAGKKAPGKSSVGTVSEYAKKAEQEAMRKEIQARMAKKAAASGKKVVKKKVVSNKKLAATTGASTLTLSGDSVKKK
jgi:hypothetical protein